MSIKQNSWKCLPQSVLILGNNSKMLAILELLLLGAINETQLLGNLLRGRWHLPPETFLTLTFYFCFFYILENPLSAAYQVCALKFISGNSWISVWDAAPGELLFTLQVHFTAFM